MRELLEPTAQPAHKRVVRGAYWRLLAAVFRWGKVPFSKVLARVEKRAPWPGHDAHWDSLEAYAQWLPKHVRWTPDRLNGLIDAFPTRETIAAQFLEKGIFENDCDGLAYCSAQNLIRLLRDPNKITIVTVVMDPFSFEQQPLLYAAHVILIFWHEGFWRVISNDTLYPDKFEHFAEAIQHNPYCRQHPVLWVEVRDKDLHLYAAGANLLSVQQKMQKIWRKKEMGPFIA